MLQATPKKVQSESVFIQSPQTSSAGSPSQIDMAEMLAVNIHEEGDDTVLTETEVSNA